MPRRIFFQRGVKPPYIKPIFIFGLVRAPPYECRGLIFVWRRHWLEAKSLSLAFWTRLGYN